MNKTGKTIAKIVTAIGLAWFIYWLFHKFKKKFIKSKGFLFNPNPIQYTPELIYKNGKGDLGITQVTFVNTIKDKKGTKYLDLELQYNIYLTDLLKPESQSRINVLNPGLREEVIEHENIHIELWNEIYQNMKYEYNNVKYDGAIDQIVEQIINDNQHLADVNSKEKLVNTIQPLIDLGTGMLLDIYPSTKMNEPQMGVENEVNRRLQMKYPNQKLYSSGELPIKE